MISILIPVFNRDVVKLVFELIEQLEPLKSSSEIIVIDDGSELAYTKINGVLAGLPYVKYLELPSNIGRIRTRQKLAATARFDWLLFLDCDSIITSGKFLKAYRDELTNNKKVIVGGRIYDPRKPTACHFVLHWKYGTNREATRFNDRRHTNRFMTNNFLISKSVFQTFDFEKGWGGYGYEDTWMAIQLGAMDVSVEFINNPVLHDGVEIFSDFIKKSEEALENLKRLSESISPGILAKYVKLYSYYHRLKSLKLLWALDLGFSLLQRSMKQNLHSCNPSLALFDLYRIHYYSKLANSY